LAAIIVRDADLPLRNGGHHRWTFDGVVRLRAAANDVKEMFSMWLRLVGGRRAGGAVGVFLLGRLGAIQN
jgi:hypothetical protein